MLAISYSFLDPDSFIYTTIELKLISYHTSDSFWSRWSWRKKQRSFFLVLRPRKYWASFKSNSFHESFTSVRSVHSFNSRKWACTLLCSALRSLLSFSIFLISFVDWVQDTKSCVLAFQSFYISSLKEITQPRNYSFSHMHVSFILSEGINKVQILREFHFLKKQKKELKMGKK